MEKQRLKNEAFFRKPIDLKAIKHEWLLQQEAQPRLTRTPIFRDREDAEKRLRADYFDDHCEETHDDLDLINLAIDNEQEEGFVKDWILKLNVSLRQSIKHRRRLSPDKIDNALIMDALFADTPPQVLIRVQ
nr:probable lysine-specific demethylase ELF6 [Tanacetum cinerariifolium]